MLRSFGYYLKVKIFKMTSPLGFWILGDPVVFVTELLVWLLYLDVVTNW